MYFATIDRLMSMPRFGNAVLRAETALYEPRRYFRVFKHVIESSDRRSQLTLATVFDYHRALVHMICRRCILRGGMVIIAIQLEAIKLSALSLVPPRARHLIGPTEKAQVSRHSKAGNNARTPQSITNNSLVLYHKFQSNRISQLPLDYPPKSLDNYRPNGPPKQPPSVGFDGTASGSEPKPPPRLGRTRRRIRKKLPCESQHAHNDLFPSSDLHSRRTIPIPERCSFAAWLGTPNR